MVGISTLNFHCVTGADGSCHLGSLHRFSGTAKLYHLFRFTYAFTPSRPKEKQSRPLLEKERNREIEKKIEKK
jgi:hypothetical protein